MPKVTLLLAGLETEPAQLLLELKDSPLTDAIITALRSPKEAVQARKSGAVLCILLGEEDLSHLEGPYRNLWSSANFGEGAVFYSPAFNEVGIAYGDTRWTDDKWQPSQCIPLGWVDGGDNLVSVGESTWNEGRAKQPSSKTPPNKPAQHLPARTPLSLRRPSLFLIINIA